MAKYNQPISREELKQKLSLSSTDIYGGLQSLTRRFLLTQVENDKKVLFDVPSLIKKITFF
jgi:biotin operon repressor